MRAVVRQPHMEDFRLETEQVLAQLQNAIDGFRPRDEHLLADVMLSCCSATAAMPPMRCAHY